MQAVVIGVGDMAHLFDPETPLDKVDQRAVYLSLRTWLQLQAIAEAEKARTGRSYISRTDVVRRVLEDFIAEYAKHTPVVLEVQAPAQTSAAERARKALETAEALHEGARRAAAKRGVSMEEFEKGQAEIQAHLKALAEGKPASPEQPEEKPAKRRGRPPKKGR
jgi:hypothetical protein